MKTARKSIIIPILVGAILTSCNRSVSTPSMNPTRAIETSVVIIQPSFTDTAMPLSTATLFATQILTPYAHSVDGHNPESVIRGYFDALVRGDSATMASVLSRKYGQSFHFEPINSLEILEIELLSDISSTWRIYSVLYNVQWKVKEGSGLVRWTFYLSWDENRDSWIITNYGCC